MGTRDIYEYAATAMGPKYWDFKTWKPKSRWVRRRRDDADGGRVGQVKMEQDRNQDRDEMPNWAAAPKRNIFGLKAAGRSRSSRDCR
jgi:hypothetical protein